jgi:hypothetical protein
MMAAAKTEFNAPELTGTVLPLFLNEISVQDRVASVWSKVGVSNKQSGLANCAGGCRACLSFPSSD